MLHLDANIQTNSSFGSLLAFKPRQVLLAQHNPTTMTTSASKVENSTRITSEFKGNLHGMMLDYFHRNGFAKTFKRFQSEAQIQTDVWKASSFSFCLEDLFCKHTACNVGRNKNASKKPVLGNDEAMEKEKICSVNEETTTKKKKKKVIVESDNCAIKDQSEDNDKKKKKSSKILGQISTDITVDEVETQPIKKKTKLDLVSSTDAINESKIVDLTKKRNDKKKKNNENELVVTEVEQKEKRKKKKSSTDENITIQPDVIKEEKKSSKKRKRSFSDENENTSTEITISEKSKLQKTETFQEKKKKKIRKEETNAQETSNKQFDGETNGKLEIDAVKSKKKQSNVAAEPKTINAFQRVKIDEVEFAHDKLQDNSYWAKDGAEIGYGAKAQEVLGQVRGRDFRHEKTKKKRGSYKGGLIDQDSHSIKFTYSDED